MGGTVNAPVLVFFAVPALALCIGVGWRRVPRGQLAARCVLIVYVTGLVGVTLFPLPVGLSEIRLQRRIVRGDPGMPRVLGNAIPGKGILNDVRTAERGRHFGVGWLRGLTPIWGNFVLLLPLGYLLPCISVRWRRWRRIATTLLLTALAFELVQLAASLGYGFPFRRVDVDTVWMSFAGGMVGYALYRTMAPALRQLGLDALVGGSTASSG